jgi:colanic acid/amylovoran biosynthesis glycosyltransferase
MHPHPSSVNARSNPGVLIYTPHLLPPGQHYVREHALRLQRYSAVLAGRRSVDGMPLDPIPSFTIGSNFRRRLREFHFLLTGGDSTLAAFAQRHNVQLIHAHFGPGGAEIMGVAERLQIPLIVTFHGWDAKLPTEIGPRITTYERLYRWRLPQLLRQASAMVCVSHSWRERLLAWGCPPERVHTNYLGVDCQFFDGLRGSFESKSILYVGRLIPQKGVHILLEAMRILRDRGVAAHLSIIGNGPQREALEKIAAEQNLAVHFLGHKPLSQIRELLRSTAVLCAPSITAGGLPAEAFGLVLLEAQAMSVPVVGTDNGGIPETLQHGRTGLLVAQNSPHELADALAMLIENESLNRSFGENARTFALRNFDITLWYRKLEDLYDRVRMNAARPQERSMPLPQATH